jgi:hypothetical protein
MNHEFSKMHSNWGKEIIFTPKYCAFIYIYIKTCVIILKLCVENIFTLYAVHADRKEFNHTRFFIAHANFELVYLQLQSKTN